MNEPTGVPDDSTRASSALERKARALQLLSAVGVSTAESFDITDILRKTRDAASSLLDGRPVDVLYLGRPSINSRARWFPTEPVSGGLTPAERKHIAESSSVTDGLGPNRQCLPIRHQDELLGCLFVQASAKPSGDVAQLLSILSLQTATALRNVHLTQERIHFERLSAIGRMIGSVAHDFRSPLTALRGYAGMLARADLTNEERTELSRFVTEECDRLNHMVEELLEFTRGGRAGSTLRRFSLDDYLEALVTRLRAHDLGGGIRVELDLGYAGEILLDRERMDRALWNVLTNACQAMSGRGRLGIRTIERDGAIVIEVEDDGSGIPDEIRHRIFEPFFSHGKSEGVGLGMAIARRIVEEHEGRVEVGGSSSGGALIRFVLPKRDVETTVELAADTIGDRR